jgi:3-deoxy-manno-octulosonate cytidylyltransferase (CMP-KDO synthetase)
MTVIAVVPARYASQRLPGKPLLKETGKYLIQHVVEQVGKTKGLDDVIVATDDQRIMDACKCFGAHAILTRADHPTGTDRIAEVAEKLWLSDTDIIINVQGDEPEIPPPYIAELVNLAKDAPTDFPMATLATPLPADRADDPNRVKVIFSPSGRALYFSRARIPFDRDRTGQVQYFLHLGIYSYRAGFLRRFIALPQAPAEKAEKLEQLRALEHGYGILVVTVPTAHAGIDTPADYAAFVQRWKMIHTP